MRSPPVFLLTIILVSAVVLLLLGVSAISPFTGNVNTNAADALTATPLSAPTEGFGNPSKGTGGIALTEFGDFLCGPCRQVENDVSRLADEYKGKIRVVWKDLPNSANHPEAPTAAAAARCADAQGAFWDYHDLLFANQEDIGPLTYPAFAKAANMDVDAFSACLESKRTVPLVDRDTVEALRLRVDATPYFFIGKTRLSGAVSYDDLKTAIESALRVAP